MVFFYINLKVTKNKLKIICIALNIVCNCTHKPNKYVPINDCKSAHPRKARNQLF